jgi:hypothetical protein
MPTDPNSEHSAGTTGEHIAGTCRFMLAYDMGFAIDLERARQRLTDAAPYQIVRGRRPSPGWFGYQPAPLRLVVDVGSLALGGYETVPTVEMLIYDFGAILVTYSIAFEGSPSDLPGLSVLLYDNQKLLDHSRSCVERVFESVREAVERPLLRSIVEDYCVFSIHSRSRDESPVEFFGRCRHDFGRAIEAESGPLSEEQLDRTIGAQISYGMDDLAVIDWNAAILIDPEPNDIIAVLQHANVELLQLRILDEELDSILDHSDELLSRFVKRR